MSNNHRGTALAGALACVVGSLCTGLAASALAQTASCGMAHAFDQNDADAKGGKTPVWAGAANDAGPASLMFVEKLNVNTDGTRRSYKVSDFWGEGDALNNLCNAMADKCAGLKTEPEMRARRVLTQEAKRQNWPADLTAQTRIAGNIIPMPGGKPCPEIDGFLVSATALHRPGMTDVCAISNYVDALATPAIVLPRDPSEKVRSEFRIRGARVGDLVATLRPGSTTPVFAVVGDLGPPAELGEGNLALNGKLLGKTKEPANYKQVMGRSPHRPSDAWMVPPTFVLVFPGTRNETDPFMTVERIDKEASKLFEQWGGLSRANGCIQAYRS